MYRGLPITTNKVPARERADIPHHLLDVVGLEERPWTVTRFVRECVGVVDGVRRRGKVPILVGGTHYYTQSLVCRDALLGDADDGAEVDGDGDGEGHAAQKWEILEAPTERIYEKLREVDPVMASRWHPKDRRHIQRSLEIWLQSGRKASEVYEEQKRQKTEKARAEEEGKWSESGNEAIVGSREELRYPSLFLWVGCEDSTLKRRLDDRVGAMVDDGLLDEALSMAEFERSMVSQGVPIDKTKGIWVSIGYKELEPWLHASRDGGANPKELSLLRDQGIEAIKAATRQYAKRQTRWIRIRLANVLKAAGVMNNMFLLDGSDLDSWRDFVEVPSLEIASAFLKGLPLPDPPSVSDLARRTFGTVNGLADATSSRTAQHCEVCDKTLMTEKEWFGHLNSNSHKKAVAGRRKHEAHVRWKAAAHGVSDLEPE